MGPDEERVIDAALKLPPEARAALAGFLLESLDQKCDPDAEEAWQREVLERIQELDSGTLPSVPWSEAHRTIVGK